MATARHLTPAAVKIIKFWKGDRLEAMKIPDSILLNLFMRSNG